MKRLPSFPTHQGTPLPRVLNPLNPRHYWLLLKWIYFQPSSLKHYLYRTDSELYRAQAASALGPALRVPAYRNPYLMCIVLVLLIFAGAVGIVSLAQGTPLNWQRLGFGVGVAAAFSATFGVIGGLTVVIAGGVSDALEFNTARLTAVTVVSSVTAAVAGGVAGGMALGVPSVLAVGVAGGVAVGVGFVVTGGILSTLAFVIVLISADVIAISIVLSIVSDVVSGITFGAAIGIGGSRVLFYLFEWPLAILCLSASDEPCARMKRHPVIGDELTVWPLPGAVSLLGACFVEDLDQGLDLAARLTGNPFQRWAVQRALSDYLANQPDPLRVLYHLVHSPKLDDYVLTPLSERQFRNWTAVRTVLLGEIGQSYIDGTGGPHRASEHLVWRLTRRWRRTEATPISRFGAMLRELIDTEPQLESIDIQEINLAKRFESVYTGVRDFKHGDEVADSFGAIASFLDARTIGVLAKVPQQLGWMDVITAPFMRPAVIEVIKALGDVSREIAACERATNPGQKSAALNRAAGALNELTRYVKREALPPERVLLARVVELWQSIVAAEQGRLGQAALRELTPAARRAAGIVERTSGVWQRPVTPFDNPYVAGAPVYPPLLVGRKDVFNRIGEVWSAKANPDSIILYGHRRMGKSSILRNLDQAAPPGSVIVYADMAGETSFVESTADLLLGLADRIHAAVRRAYPATKLSEPDPDACSTPPRAQFQFDRLMEQVREALGGRTLILALDEFEAVEQAVKAGKIGIEIYQFLRTKTQEPWLTLVLGGLHTLDEMSRDYQQPFYGSYENMRVSYLAHDDAWRLITNPTGDFGLNYEPEAVERIIVETGGQPYLVQQICRDALDHLNHELFDLEAERPALIRLSDVEAALGDDFFRRGTVYFDGIWTQASGPDQRALLRTMAQRDELWTLSELETATGLSPDALRRELRWAERHDILRKLESDPLAWHFHVPLLRRWIRRMR